MPTLRERLVQVDPGLYASLERSWNTAYEEWLPALSVSKGSFNSYPHLRNLEDHLDRIAASTASTPGSVQFLGLSAVEIYVLLVSVLLHDIGRIKDSDAHGVASREIIMQQYPQLGISSVELANVIADICLYHEPPKDEDKCRELEESLRTVVVDPYGEVRKKELACYLKLVDNMDSAFLRVVPDYLLDAFAQREPVGAFRRVISGVQLDPDARMIRTVLRDDLTVELPKGLQKYKNLILKKQVADLAAIVLPCIENWASCAERMTGRDGQSVKFLKGSSAQTAGTCTMGFCTNGAQSALLSKLQIPADDFYGPHCLIASQMPTVEKQEKEKMAGWTTGLLLACVMSNLKESRVALSGLMESLTSAGLPIESWVLDYREHLYDHLGWETFEPIFDHSFLKKVVDCMYKLSSGVLGQSNFTYDVLASELRESDTRLVKTAVRRISIVCEDEVPEKKDKEQEKQVAWRGAIRYGQDTWSWRASCQPSSVCQFVTHNSVIEKIGGLCSPKEKKG